MVGGRKMAKLGEFQTPTGAKGNILNPGDWLGLIVGAVVLIITFAVGQNLAGKVGSRLPIDTQVDQPWTSPIPVVKNDKQKVVL
jgi:hypothetical protein